MEGPAVEPCFQARIALEHDARQFLVVWLSHGCTLTHSDMGCKHYFSARICRYVGMDEITEALEWIEREWQADRRPEAREALARYYVAEMHQREKEGRL
jgi:hypothetical protein